MKAALFAAVSLLLASSPAQAAAPTPPKIAEGSNLLQATNLDDHAGWALVFDSGAAKLAVLRTTDGGGSWQSAPLPTGKLDLSSTSDGSIVFLDAKHGWASFMTSEGMNRHYGGVFASSDGGKTWKKLSDTPALRLSFADARLGFAISEPAPSEPGQSILRTTDGGKSWADIKLKGDDHLGSILGARFPAPGVAQGVVVFVHLEPSATATYVTDDNGKTWSATKPIDAGGVEVVGPREVWVDGDTQSFHTTDGGRTWTAGPMRPTPPTP